MERTGRRAALYAAIAARPADQRAPLVLHQFEELPYEEVARILAATVPTIKGRTFRARRALADLLREWR